MKDIFPDIKSFSPTNIKYIRYFYEMYPTGLNRPQLGDGSSLYAFQYTDSSMEPEMEESELWKPLPFSDAVSDLINNSIGDECAESIPEISNGYYFFYDRHSEAADPFDESALWSRSSINCTLAIYDADEDIMYVLIKDT